MPCVLPVLSLKLLNIIKNCKEDSTTARANLIFSTAGVITSFILLAIVTQVLKILGTSVGWGFHFQEPGFIIFLIIVLILFASNLWGDFEINLPTWINKVHNLSSTKLSYANSFLSGAFATLLATPCTAPFLTVAVAFGLSQDFIYLVIIYFFIGVGMSLPFIVLAIKTSLLKLFPKPGRWMIKLKKFFAILLLLTALWLIYVLSFQLSIQAILIFFGSLVIIKAIITNKLIFKTFNSKFVLVLVAITVAYSITFKTETKQQYHKFEIENMWERFSESKLYQYINEGHIVFVDITAEWCLTCKINKFKALEQKDITQLFRDKKIKLLRGDYTNKSPELNTFLLRYNHYGIPFNAIYSKKYPNGILLPELLSKSDIQDNINKAK
jgi:suppressor for copper-sensitivity B